MIRNTIRDGGVVVVIVNDKVSVNEKLNLKSCKNDGNIRQEKWVKFNEEITVFNGTSMGTSMMLKGLIQDGASMNTIIFG